MEQLNPRVNGLPLQTPDDSALPPALQDTIIHVNPGQQIHVRSKIDSFQNANFLISQPNPMMLPLIGIVLERRFQ